MHKHLVRPCFLWPEPFSSSQGRKTQNKEPKCHRTSARSVVWTDCCTPFLQRTCSQYLQQDVITLPVKHTSFLHPTTAPPQPDPLINCTLCSTADRSDLSRLYSTYFCSSPCDENNFENLPELHHKDKVSHLSTFGFMEYFNSNSSEWVSEKEREKERNNMGSVPLANMYLCEKTKNSSIFEQ